MTRSPLFHNYKVVAVLFFLLLPLVSSLLEGKEAARRAAEWSALRELTQAIFFYVDEHDGIFPENLNEVKGDEIVRHWNISLDQIIYVAPQASAVDLPPGTVLLVFPYNDGALLAHIEGNISFSRGGHGEQFQEQLKVWRVGAVISLGANVLLILVLLYCLGASKRKPFQG